MDIPDNDILLAARAVNAAYEAGMRTEREGGEAVCRLKRLIERIWKVVQDMTAPAPHYIVAGNEQYAAALRAALIEATDSMTPEKSGWVQAATPETVVGAVFEQGGYGFRHSNPAALTSEQPAPYRWGDIYIRLQTHLDPLTPEQRVVWRHKVGDGR